MKNSGVTLIALTVTVIVLIILTAIFVSSGLDALNEAKNAKIDNEIAQLKKAIINEYTNYMKNSSQNTLTGTLAKNKWNNSQDCINKIIKSMDLKENGSEEDKLKIEQINKEINRDYSDYVMIISSGDMLRLGLENYSDTNTYIVNYNTSAVYGPLY